MADIQVEFHFSRRVLSVTAAGWRHFNRGSLNRVSEEVKLDAEAFVVQPHGIFISCSDCNFLGAWPTHHSAALH